MSQLVVIGRLAAAAALLAFSSGCPNDVAGVCTDGGACPTNPGDTPPRLYVDPPFGIGFTCATLGCDESRPLLIENRGGGTARLSLVRLAVDASTDFDAARADGAPLPVAEAQHDLPAGATLELTVSYAPSDALDDQGEIWIDWYDGAVAYEDARVERIAIPLSSRVLGDATATTTADALLFGYVATGSSATLPFVVHNDGDAVLQVGPASLDAATAPAYSILSTAPQFVNPGESAQVQVVFAPTAAEASFGTLYLETNDAARPRIPVSLLGTAIADPRIALVDPVLGTVDFGQVRIDAERTREIVVMNLGGQPLEVTPRLVAGAESGFAVDTPSGAARVTVHPLTETRLTVSLRPAQGGLLPGRVVLGANDPAQPETDVTITAYGAAPTALIDPTSLEFGTIVQNWVTEAQSIGIRNSGTGELTISAISFEIGSSSQIQLASVPALPIKLSPTDAPLQIAVYVMATTVGEQTGVLLIETDQIGATDVLRIPIHALVVDCATGCPTTNGTPDCSSGRCEIGSCLAGYHDADTVIGTGCECREDQIGNDVRDIGEQCGPALDLGPLNDNGGTEETTRSGTLHDADDIDLFFYRANDTDEFDFNDDYGARVELISAPPGLEICVRFNDAGNGCGGIIPDVLSPECSTTFRDGGGNGTGDDSEDVMVWVRWQPGASPMCGAYNIKFRANAG